MLKAAGCLRPPTRRALFKRASTMRQRPPLTPLVDALPSTVPFVGPEAQERERAALFARTGANENSLNTVQINQSSARPPKASINGRSLPS